MKRNKCVYEYRLPETEGGHAYYVGQGNYDRPYRPHPYKGHRGNFCIKPTDENQIVIIKDNLTEQEAKDLEIKLIDNHGRRSLGEGYLLNRTEGGEGISGYKHTKETKIKLSEANTGKKHTKETKRKLSEANKGENNPMFGIGKDHPRFGIRGKDHNRFGTKHTEETKRKMSEANKNRPFTTCIHCGISSQASGNISRWHNDNCKHKNSTVLPIPH